MFKNSCEIRSLRGTESRKMSLLNRFQLIKEFVQMEMLEPLNFKLAKKSIVTPQPLVVSGDGVRALVNSGAQRHAQEVERRQAEEAAREATRVRFSAD